MRKLRIFIIINRGIQKNAFYYFSLRTLELIFNLAIFFLVQTLASIELVEVLFSMYLVYIQLYISFNNLTGWENEGG